MSDVLNHIVDRWDDPEQRLVAYKPPMAQFLNNYLDRKSKVSESDRQKLSAGFSKACKLLVEANGRDGLKFSGRLNAAHIDAILGTLIYALTNDVEIDPNRVRDAIASLRVDSDYIDWVSRSTSHRDSVFGRLYAAYRALVS